MFLFNVESNLCSHFRSNLELHSYSSMLECLLIWLFFQRGVDCIVDWAAKKWQHKLASAKCQFIRVGLRNWSPVTYFLNDSELHRSIAVNDLGIKMHSTLSVSDHIDISENSISASFTPFTWQIC